jgi:hypothetical protein
VVKRLGLLIVFLVLIAGIWIGYTNIVKSPQYALVDLAQGLEAQNFDWVDKRVNIDTVVSHLADQVVTEELKRLNAEPDKGGMLGMLAQGMGAGVVNLMKPAIVAAAVPQIKQGVSDPKLAARVKDLGNKAAMLVIFRQMGDIKLTQTQLQGDTATMLLDANKTPVRFTWRNTGPMGWEVTQIDMPASLIRFWMSEQARTHQPLPPYTDHN